MQSTRAGCKTFVAEEKLLQFDYILTNPWNSYSMTTVFRVDNDSFLRFAHHIEKGAAMKNHELKIEGMSCGHCAVHVKKALSDLDGVEVELVEVGSARVWYDDTKINQKTLSDAIEEAGYKLVSVQ